MPQDDGALRVGVIGDVSDEITSALRDVSRPEDHSALETALDAHRAKIEATRSPADKGASIEVPQLMV